MQTLKQVLGWEEGRGKLMNLCFSLTVVIALIIVAVGLHLEFTAPGAPEGLRAESLATGRDARLP